MVIASRLFTPDELEELDLPWNCTDVEIVSKGRWSLTKRGICEIDGVTYRIHWEDGATEMQDMGPWDDVEEVVAVPVQRVEVTTVQWVEVDA